jgi:hypothetical protein
MPPGISSPVRQIPIIIFTAQRPEGDRERGFVIPVSEMGLLLSVIPPRINVRQEKTGWIKK